MNYADLFRATLPQTVLEITALLVLIADLGFLRKASFKTRVVNASFLGVAGCLMAIWGVYVAGNAGFSIDGELLLSAGSIAGVAQVGILVLTAITLLLLVGEEFTKHVGEYVAVVLMAAAGGLIISAAQDLLVIFIGLELLSLGLYILTAFAKKSGKSAEAAMKYYLFGGMSAAFLLFGFSYLYGLSGTTNLVGIESAIASPDTTPLFYVAWILVIAGLGFKIAAVPFHLWAPDTYEGAPAPAAAFIASVSKVASFTLLINVCVNVFNVMGQTGGSKDSVIGFVRNFYATAPRLGAILLVAAAASMIVGNLAALAQSSVRRLLAYSAIAHAGYMLLGVAARGSIAGQKDLLGFMLQQYRAELNSANAVLYYILTYGLTTIGAFGVVSVVERATGSDRLDSFLGLHKRNPVLAAVLMVLFLSLAGIPPLVGFWAKFNLFAAVLNVGAGPVPFALVSLAIAMSAVSLYYYLQVLKRAYVMPAGDESPIKANPVTTLVLIAIAAAVVIMGCFPALLQNWIASFYQ
jgi:NADH-quinone oxidoreductase subunit N